MRAEKERLFMRGCGKRANLLGLGAALLLAACSGGAPDKGPAGGNRTDATPSPTVHGAPPKETPAEARPQTMASDANGFAFSYKWPAEAAAIPALDAWLRSNGETLRKRGAGQAAADRAEATKSDYPFNGHSYDEEYSVVADTPRVLVLLSDGYIYSGGAHGMPVNTAIIWDKAAKQRLATGAMIAIPHLATLAKQRFCDELDRQRAEKRGEAVSRDGPGPIDAFNQCVDLTKQLILPVSTDGKALDVARVIIAPYEAGPYAEGSYVIDLALDKGLMAAVKPAYRDSFTTQ